MKIKEDILMRKLPDVSGDTGNNTNLRPDHGSPPSTPPWVKVFGVIALVLVLLFVILHLTGRGFGDHGGHTSPSSVIEQEVKQP
jgi:hypothetical protein